MQIALLQTAGRERCYRDMPHMRNLLATAAVLVLPAVALAAKPAPKSVTITAAPATVTFGHAVTISGTTSPATGVTLRSDTFPFGGSFAQVATATSNAAGAYSFTVKPSEITHYRVSAKSHPTAQSPIATVSVRWRVTRTVSTRTPKRGSRVRFSGSVYPAHAGAKAQLQRRTASGYRTVRTATLTAATTTRSHYSLRIRVKRSGTYRVHVAADSAHLAGNSRRDTLKVH
jgi:hypothetical protein